MVNAIRRGWAWLTASRSRFSLVLAVTIVGLLLWSRLIMLSDMPRTAVAGDEETPAAQQQTPEPDPSDKENAVPSQENENIRPKGASRVPSVGG